MTTQTGFPQLAVTSRPSAGRVVTYAESKTLPANTIVSLYRCLLIRGDRYERWLEDGTIPRSVDRFWRNYTIELRFDDVPQQNWLCLPVGDVNGGSDTWWVPGKLSKPALAVAMAALRGKALVDWHRTAEPSAVAADTPEHAAGRRVHFLSHLFNEPIGDVEPNVNVRAHGAFHCGRRSYCGIALATTTTKELQFGDELVWCYGQFYTRHYAVSSACKERVLIGPPTRLQHATQVLSRGSLVGRTAPHEFLANLETLGMDANNEQSHQMLQYLFKTWDVDQSGYLERDEIERGVLQLEDELG